MAGGVGSRIIGSDDLLCVHLGHLGILRDLLDLLGILRLALDPLIRLLLLGNALLGCTGLPWIEIHLGKHLSN